ncbi:MAG: carbohydrate kinase family protein [Bacteroidota bacterium]
MTRIFGLGETVLDVIFKDGQPVASRPGGSAFNALVSLARANHDVHMISEIGIDEVGEQIVAFLQENGVQTEWLYRFEKGKTPVALAFLDENNNASYQVYKDFPDLRLHTDGPEFREGDVLLFGSFFAVNPVLRSRVLPLLQKARSQGAYLIYDPNFRKHHAAGIEEYRPIVEENFALAHLVRGSDEDFETIYPGMSVDDVLERIFSFGPRVMVTANAGGVSCLVDGHRFHEAARELLPVSTIGAGDNFNAGLIHGMKRFPHLNGTLETWKEIVSYAIAFSSDVCMSFDNYISRDFVQRLFNEPDEVL